MAAIMARGNGATAARADSFIASLRSSNGKAFDAGQCNGEAVSRESRQWLGTVMQGTAMALVSTVASSKGRVNGSAAVRHGLVYHCVATADRCGARVCDGVVLSSLAKSSKGKAGLVQA